MNKLLIIFLLFCFGCSSLKQEKTSKQIAIKVQETAIATDSRTKSITEYLWTDTNSAWQKLEIKPIGQFTYSTANGFAGAASSIELSGSVQQKQRLLASQTLSNKSAVKTKGKSIALVKNVEKNTTTEKAPINRLWFIAIVLTLLGLLWWLVKKYYTISLFKLERR